MRFAFVTHGPIEKVSGNNLYNRKLVDHLRAQGHTVEVVPVPKRRFRERLLDNFSAPLLQQLAAGEFDLILQDSAVHASFAWLNLQIKKHTKAPIITIVHHLRSKEDWGLLRRLVFRRVEKDYFKTVDRFIFNSETTKKAVHQMIGEAKPYEVGYPAADHYQEDLEAFTTIRDSRSGKLKMIFVGSIIERKGLDVLLMALKQVPAGKWELDIVGDPTVDRKYVEKLHKFVEEIPRLRTAINFLGPLSQRDLAIRYSINHVLVVPSTYDGFGNVYLEGMGFGLPAVATSAGAASEIITHLENGLLLSVNDPNTLARAIKLLINDRKFLAEMSENALQTYEKFPTWAETCTKVEAFLLEIAGDR